MDAAAAAPAPVGFLFAPGMLKENQVAGACDKKVEVDD